MHHTLVEREIGVILKLDFEKAHDKVNCEFLLSCLHLKGFNDKWCRWTDQILKHDIVSVKLNDMIGPYFQSAKGVREGDPLSHMLFNLAAEVLTKMVLKGQSNNLFVGLASDLMDKGLAIMQYADDTVICLQHDLKKAVNMKLLT